MNSGLGKSWATLLLFACAMGIGAAKGAPDPGDLFPNVAPYDETVASPISKPEIKKYTPAPVPPTPPKVDPITPPTPPVTPVKPPDPTVNPPVDPNLPPVPPRKKPPRVPPTSQPAPLPAATTLVEFIPYAETVMKPIIGEEDAKVFEQGFADPITKALAGTPELRKKTADLLESSAASLTSLDLKRYLELHAFGLYIRAAISSTEREQKAQALLPLLTDRTLPVMQARADALNDLMLTFSTNPSTAFLDIYMDAHATLTKYRVQAGFPKEALDSLKKTREAGNRYGVKKPQVRTDQMNEAAAWCDRANQAVAMAPRYQDALKANPNDNFANTTMATLHIALYGNLEHAMPFAAKSDRKDMKQLADVLKENPPRALSSDPAKHAEQVLAIAAALVDVAKATSTSQMFDRYSIACFAGDHLAQVIDDGALPPAKIMEAKLLLASAKDIIDKSMLKRGDDLPKWLGGAGATAPVAVKQTIGSVGDLLKELPKELMPTEVGWTPNQMSKVTDWLSKNHVGKDFDASIFAERLARPMDGADGKVYVPVMFQFQNVQIKDGLWVKTYVEYRLPPELGKKAKDLGFEQQVQVKGVIESVMMFGGSIINGQEVVHLRLVVTSKELAKTN